VQAVSALSSVALSLNCMDSLLLFLNVMFNFIHKGIANFIVGLAFLPLRNTLSGGDSTKEGRVFYVFAGLLLLSSSIFFRSYR